MSTPAPVRARDHERLRRAAALLRDAERPVRVLRTLSWGPEVRARFFERGARELPVPRYEPLDPTSTLAAVAEARRSIRTADDPIDAWLQRQAEAIEAGALMLASVGTDAFHAHSARLYGRPTDRLQDQSSTSLVMAKELDDVLSGLDHGFLGAPAPACHLADDVATRIRSVVQRHLGDDAPDVSVVDDLSANALAGPRSIRLRRGACFSDRDWHYLVQHEAFVHVVTSLNGRAQRDLPILGAAHPGTTRTQEGLAVFAEFITGAIDPARLRRLSDRVLAIQMSIDGADFLELYRWFLERSQGEPDQAFENARRVMRGGVLTGGAPFTKDGVYLDGLLRVHNFLRSVVRQERTDCLRLLFCGKLDIEDIPALCHLAAEGLCRLPVHLPPWAADLRFLVAYLAYSGFLNRVKLDTIQAHYTDLLNHTPLVSTGASPCP